MAGGATISRRPGRRHPHRRTRAATGCPGVAGRDLIRARNGGRDRVDCGPGRDTAILDARDLAVRCEVVRRPRPRSQPARASASTARLHRRRPAADCRSRRGPARATDPADPPPTRLPTRLPTHPSTRLRRRTTIRSCSPRVTSPTAPPAPSRPPAARRPARHGHAARRHRLPDAARTRTSPTATTRPGDATSTARGRGRQPRVRHAGRRSLLGVLRRRRRRGRQGLVQLRPRLMARGGPEQQLRARSADAPRGRRSTSGCARTWPRTRRSARPRTGTSRATARARGTATTSTSCRSGRSCTSTASSS